MKEKDIDKMDRGEGRICHWCHQKIELGEMYYMSRRLTGWSASHSNISLCDSKNPDILRAREKEVT